MFPVLSFLISFSLFFPLQSLPSFENHPCTLGGTRNVRGVCKEYMQCPGARSLSQSGRSPVVCGAIVGQKVFVCCPLERRISFEKCLEYHQEGEMNAQRLSSAERVPEPKALLPSKSNDPTSQPDDKNNPEEKVSAFIVGGRQAELGQFPPAIALGFETDGSTKIAWRCGGTLLSELHVLTAAHCLTARRRTGRLRKVLVGDIKLIEDPATPLDSKAIIIGIQTIIIHPEYNATSKLNDIGILILKQKVSFSETVKPACLPQPEFRLDVETLPPRSRPLTAVGWGQLGYLEDQSDVLQFVDLHRIPLTRCNLKWRNEISEVLPSQLCAGVGSGKDTCNGDSGGGLFVRQEVNNSPSLVVLGITSIGPTLCGLDDKPGIYTNVAAFLEWIEDVVWPIAN